MPHAKLWRGMATTTASLLILSLGTSAIADSRAGFLNAQLGTSNYTTIKTDTKSAGDCKFCPNGTPILKLAVHPF